MLLFFVTKTPKRCWDGVKPPTVHKLYDRGQH